MRNYPLIRKVRDHIVANPDEHNQDQWGVRTSCGTTHCVAGHAVLLAGATPRWEQRGLGGYLMHGADWDNRRWAIGPLATHLLGLSENEADTLFFLFDNVGALDMLNRILEEE